MSFVSGNIADLVGMLHLSYLKLAHPTDAAKVVDAKAGANGGMVVEEPPGIWAPATQGAPADVGVISSAACTVRAVVLTNTSSSTVAAMLFDAAAVPPNGTVSRLPVVMVPPLSTVKLVLGALVCSAGLCWSSTTTYDKKTAGTSAALLVAAEIV